MKPLENYIKNNSGIFDSEEPLDGHFDRFDLRLRKNHLNKGRRMIYLVFKIAAVLILGVVISYAAFMEFRILEKNMDQFFTTSQYPELNEAEQYYNSQLNIYYSKFNDLHFNNKDQKKQILEELEDMDRQVKIMKHDLLQSPDDERIVHAIINFYQVKLEMMDMIIQRTQTSAISIL